MSPKEDLDFITKAPSFLGISRQESEALLEKFNIPYSVEGKSGYVVSQNIEAGTLLDNKNEIILTYRKPIRLLIVRA
jgi:beta-lactam-binding protein with PASTA domain